MTAIRPEQLGADGSDSEKSGLEKHAPNCSVPEKLADVDQAAATAVEGEIREFVRRDVAFLRRQRSEGDAATVPAAENLNELISPARRWRKSTELQGVRDMLRSEGERVSRELAGYGSLNDASMTAMKVIGHGLKQWKSATGNHNRRSAG